MKTYNKYSNKKIEIDGHKFDSKKEARRYVDLKLLLRAKQIANLELQPTFVLQDSFKHNDKQIRQITYIADFMYQKDCQCIVEDVKGFKTDVYNLKKKLFLNKFGKHIDFREI